MYLKRTYLQTMYGWGQKKNSHPAINVSNDTSTTTSETNRDMSSYNNNIRDSAENSNHNQNHLNITKPFDIRNSKETNAVSMSTHFL